MSTKYIHKFVSIVFFMICASCIQSVKNVQKPLLNSNSNANWESEAKVVQLNVEQVVWASLNVTKIHRKIWNRNSPFDDSQVIRAEMRDLTGEYDQLESREYAQITQTDSATILNEATTESTTMPTEYEGIQTNCVGDSELVITGITVQVNQINFTGCEHRINHVKMFALEKIVIDADIDLPQTDLSIVAPQWSVLGNRIISVNGTNGETPIAPVKSSVGPGGVADAGAPGYPGTNAGHFIGIGQEFENEENLIIHGMLWSINFIDNYCLIECVRYIRIHSEWWTRWRRPGRRHRPFG